jgi:hypothetical protein
MRFTGACTVAILLFSGQAWAANDSRTHRPRTQTPGTEAARPPRDRINCDLAAHETDGTTTCLDRPQARESRNGDMMGDRSAPTGLPGLSTGPDSY